VLVPDLEAVGKNSDRAMISWLERGLSSGGEDGELTEFLIAPIQAKGLDASPAKKWVDGVKRRRETQEMRRLLYVAATRARQELHMFARPRYSVDKKGEYALASPGRSLLGTAWPSLQPEVEEEFSDWVAANFGGVAKEEPEGLVALAASEGSSYSNLLAMPPPVRPTLVRRLPAGYVAPEFSGLGGNAGADIAASAFTEPEALYARTEGGLLSRIEGIAVHQFLERLSRAGGRNDDLAGAVPGVTSMIRGYGIAAGEAGRLLKRALAVAERAAADPVGAWILSAHAGAASETKWTGVIRGQLWNLQPDRVFLARHWAEDAGDPVWWIIDYKTTHAGGAEFTDAGAREEFLSTHRSRYGGQLSAYAGVFGQFLRGLGENNLTDDDIPIRVGIYYPRLPLFDWWEA
jgi:hypothetical protein